MLSDSTRLFFGVLTLLAITLTLFSFDNFALRYFNILSNYIFDECTKISKFRVKSSSKDISSFTYETPFYRNFVI